MKTMNGSQAAAVLLAVAMSSAMVGRAEKPIAPGKQDSPQQDSGQQAKHFAEDKVLVQLDGAPGENQEAQQKVMLEFVAADAQIVKGKPYSADQSTETAQTLPDGNRIVHHTVSKFYRDSEGRTRREQTFGNVDPEHPTPHEVKVFIDDPVSSTSFVVDPGSKTADKMQLTHVVSDGRNGEDEGARILFKSDRDSQAGAQVPPGPMLIKFRDEQAANPLAVVVQDEKRDVKKEDLGARNIEGVDCNGTRQTITIPAGAIGNEKPIAMVTETWFAPAIGAVVESIADDPRYGKTTYRLTNVQLSEPSRSLFEPPANFKVSARK